MTPMIEPVVPVSISQLEREIADATQKLTFVVMPPLQHLRNEVSRLTTLATLDPKHRADLQLAIMDLEAAQRTVDDAQSLKKQVEAMRTQLDQAKQQERLDLVQRTNKRLAKASEEYLRCGNQLIAAYRSLLDVQQRSRRVPGATDIIPAGFDFLPANPEGWMGSTSEMMVSGNLPFENADKDAA